MRSMCSPRPRITRAVSYTHLSSDTAETAPVALILDSAVEAGDIGQPMMTDTFFEIAGKDDTKITGRLDVYKRQHLHRRHHRAC